jgi:outer membrane protein assembly factor BamB
MTPTGETDYTDDSNWRMFGHDTGNTFRNPHAEGPSDDPSIQWTLDGVGDHMAVDFQYYHPLIVDGTIYITREHESTRNLEDSQRDAFMAVDPDTGETETLFTVDGAMGRQMIADGTVYVGVTTQENTTIRAYDLPTGTEQWRQSDPDLQFPSTIRRTEDVVLVTHREVLPAGVENTSNQQFAFDATTGELLWKSKGATAQIENVLPSIIVDGMAVYPYTKEVRDLQSGEQRAQLPDKLLTPSLVDGVLYGITRENRKLRSYDWETLEQRWTYPPDGQSENSLGWLVTYDDIVIANIYGNGLMGIDRDTGEQLWHTMPWDDELGAIIRVVSQDTLYVSHAGGAATALDPTTGEIIWQIKTDRMEWNPVYGCALADDLLLTVGYHGRMFAIS